ncbi:MAG: cobalt-precorrin-5B (C(1))-methyltransferase CbiD [Bacteroidota bacterium]|nr:cobalt-precorrin-5B (C(1))-methyltransferase CbiD [Bacteroidota bacterium]
MGALTDKIVSINGKEYRYGYTTGSCAAAAAKASALMLLTQKAVEEISVVIPDGGELELMLHEVVVTNEFASCCVVKDAGDDPDVTHGIRIYAKVWRNDLNEIRLLGGTGVGRVTKKGLAVPVGEPAINPVPRKMILQNVASVTSNGCGLDVEISAPEGVALAQKTFNPQLGIEGGISILGTKGIVVPMSEEAYKESLAIKLSMLQAYGIDEAVFTPGNYGLRFIENHLSVNPELVVTTSNFIGFMLDEAVRYGFRKILLVGHIGKLIKVAGGIFHTHSRVADARNEVFAAHYLMFSGDVEACRLIMQSNTTEESIQYVTDKSFYNYLCNIIKQRCEQYVKQALKVDMVLFSESEGWLGQAPPNPPRGGGLKEM